MHAPYYGFVRGHYCNSSRQKFKPREVPLSVPFLSLAVRLYADASDNVTLHCLRSWQPEPIGCGLAALLRWPGHRPSRNRSSAELEMFVFDTAAQQKPLAHFRVSVTKPGLWLTLDFFFFFSPRCTHIHPCRPVQGTKMKEYRRVTN